MCIAIYNPQSAATIDFDTFLNCWTANPHGAGMMWVENGKIRTSKRLKKMARMHDEYLALRLRNISPIVLHFRIATQGPANIENCHPFFVDQDLAVVHNGILDTDFDIKKSDTRLFIQSTLRKLPRGWLKEPGLRELVTSYTIGSKFVFLDRWGNVNLLHEKDGEWSDGSWFSNNSYLPYTKIWASSNEPTYTASQMAEWGDDDWKLWEYERYKNSEQKVVEDWAPWGIIMDDNTTFCAECFDYYARPGDYKEAVELDGTEEAWCYSCGTRLDTSNVADIMQDINDTKSMVTVKPAKPASPRYPPTAFGESTPRNKLLLSKV